MTLICQVAKNKFCKLCFISDELEPDVELSGKEAAEVNKSNLLQQSGMLRLYYYRTL